MQLSPQLQKSYNDISRQFGTLCQDIWTMPALAENLIRITAAEIGAEATYKQVAEDPKLFGGLQGRKWLRFNRRAYRNARQAARQFPAVAAEYDRIMALVEAERAIIKAATKPQPRAAQATAAQHHLRHRAPA